MVGMAIVGLSAVDAYSVLQKRDGAHAHDHGHAAAAPSDGYGEPAASYGAPAASYSEPSPSYGEPAASYGEPAPAYGALKFHFGIGNYKMFSCLHLQSWGRGSTSRVPCPRCCTPPPGARRGTWRGTPGRRDSWPW